jgi:hypothetical protein
LNKIRINVKEEHEWFGKPKITENSLETYWQKTIIEMVWWKYVIPWLQKDKEDIKFSSVVELVQRAHFINCIKWYADLQAINEVGAKEAEIKGIDYPFTLTDTTMGIFWWNIIFHESESGKAKDTNVFDLEVISKLVSNLPHLKEYKASLVKYLNFWIRYEKTSK